MKKVNKNDEFLRLAMLDVYKYKCIYTDNKLEYKDLQIDHIIPASYKNQKKRLDQIIEECELGKDFEIDSLYNLVPTNKARNRQKSDNEFSTKNIRFFLEIASKNVAEIEKKIEELRRKRNVDTYIAMLKGTVNEEKDKNEREDLINNIISIITDEEDEVFGEQERVYSEDDEKIFMKYSSRIKLKAIMPRYNNTETQCIFHFKNLKVKNCTVILDNKRVLSELFRGIYTDPKYGTRGFINYERLEADYEIPIVDLNEVSIDLGDTKLKLSSDDIYDLCDCIDSYASMYIEFIKEIEEVLKTDKYPLSKRRNNYKFLTLSYEDWQRLIEFANKYDVDNGRSQWHIFDRNNFYLKIFTNSMFEKYDFGYHAFFHAEHSEDIVLYPQFSTKNVYITWEYSYFRKDGIDKINERTTWNAEMAYDWLVNKYIPKVLENNSWSNIFRIKRRRDNRSIIGNIEFVYYLQKLKVNTVDELYEIVNLLQGHFYSNPHSRYRVNKVQFQGIYKSIIKCLEKSNRVDVRYISNNLYLGECTTKDEVMEAITELSERIGDMTITGFGVDLLFRGLLATLDSKVELESEDINFIRNNLDYFIKLHDRETLIAKYAIDFE